MKKVRLFIAMALALVLAICVFVACDPKTPTEQNPIPPATDEISVTFNLLDEGANVVKTGKAGEALEVPSLGDTANYHFGGWHRKMDLSDDAFVPSVFPERNETYYAEWYMSYSFKVTLEQLDDTFAHTSQYDVEGKVTKGSRDSVMLTGAQIADIPGFNAEASSYSITFEQGKKDYECEVRYLRAPLEITYVTGIGDDIVKQTKFGASAIGEDDLGEFSARHFIGWSDAQDGELTYASGAAIEKQGALTLYALWEIGLADLLGGQDCLYLSKSDPNVVYLERYGSDEPFAGTLSGTLFSVKINGNFTLDGAILDDGFYYFKDTLEKTYKNVENVQEKLEFVTGGKGKAILHAESGNVEGKYTFDPERSEYSFVPDQGQAFVFKLLSSGGELCFERADEQLRGYYALPVMVQNSEDYILFFFDGFGGAEASVATDIVLGEYQWDENTKCYVVWLDDGSEFYLRLNSDGAGSQKGDVVLKGGAENRDDLAGSYGPALAGKVQKDTDAEDDLTLDGFGKGTYKGIQIEYTYETRGWYEENPYDDDAYGMGMINWVTFTYEGKSITLCIEDSQSNNANFYIPVNGEFAVEYFADTQGLGSIYDGNDYENVDGALGVFMYKYGKSEGAIVTVFSLYVGAVTGTQVMTELDWGVIEKREDIGANVYQYTSTYDYFDKTYDIEFLFVYDGNGDIVPQLYDRTYKLSDKLSINEFGEATYVGEDGIESVGYVVDNGFNITFVTFPEIPNASGEGTHAEVYKVNFGEDDKISSFEYLEGFHMITDVVNQCAIATVPTQDANKFTTYIGIKQGNVWYYVLEGTATLTEGTAGAKDAVYEFVMDPATAEETEQFLRDQGDDVYELMAQYFSFTYKITDPDRGECDFVAEEREVTNSDEEKLVFGSDGTLSIVRNGETERANSYHYLTENVLEAYVVKSGVRYNRYVTLTFDNDGNISDFIIGGEEANIYYPESELNTGLEIFNRYFILLGDGVGIMASSSADMSIMAEYEATGKTFDFDGVHYIEYKIGVCYDAQDDIPDIFYYIAATFEDFDLEGGLKWHGGKYLERTYSVIEKMEIVGGGYVECDGYHRGTYVNENGASYSAAVYYVNVFDRYFNESTYPEASENGEPTNNVYIAYYDRFGNILDRIIFDIVGGKLDERDGYNGVFVEVVNNAPGSDERYIYLDGQGNVIVYNGDDQETERGKYSLAPELGDQFLIYTPADVEESEIGTFAFRLFRMDGISCYIKYEEENQGAFHGENGELLITDGFAQGVYMDKYGVVMEGLCTYLTSDHVVFIPYGETEGTYFQLDATRMSFATATALFVTEGNVLVRYNGTEKDITALPSGITEIADRAFQEAAIRSINLSGVTKIGNEAFMYCEELESVIVPNVVTVGSYAFAGCTSLESIELPLAETISSSAFIDVPLRSVKLNAITSIAQYAFAHEISVTTIFDLTDCDTLASLSAPDNAFISRVDGANGATPINMKVYAKDVEALNLLIANDSASDILKNTAGLHIESDPMNGAVYIGFATASVYAFDAGTLIKRVGNSSNIFGVYVMGDSGVDIYVRGADGYAKSADNITATSVLELDDQTLFKNGVAHTLTSSDDHTVTFTLQADASSAFTTTTASASLDGSEAASATLMAEIGGIRINVEGKGYFNIKVTGADSCEITELGSRLELYSSDAEKFYRFTGFVKDGKITELLDLAFHSGDSVDPQDPNKFTPIYTSYAYENLNFAGDGSVTFDWKYSDALYTIKVAYVAGSEGDDSIDVEILSVTLSGNATGSKAEITVTFDITEFKVQSISYFAFTASTGFFADPVEEKIVSFEVKEHHQTQSEFDENEPAGVTVLELITENGTYTVTVTARRNPAWGNMRTYSFGFTVEKTA